jgi:hypothetical protein
LSSREKHKDALPGRGLAEVPSSIFVVVHERGVEIDIIIVLRNGGP